MKKTRRIAAFIAAMAMAATLAVPSVMMSASAAGTGVITITDASGATHNTLSAFQIFTADVDANHDLIVTGWGDGVNITDLSAAIVADTDLSTAIGALTNDAAGAKAAATAISNLTPANAEKLAKLIAKNTAGNGKAAEATSGSTTIVGLDNGYYIVVDTAAATKDSYTAYTLGMLAVVNGQTTNATTKLDFPSFDKQIGDINDTTDAAGTYTFNEAADHDIGDDVPFKLIATIPSNIEKYDTYKMIFHDNLQDGVFNFNNDIVVRYYSSDSDTTGTVVTSAFTKATTNNENNKFTNAHGDKTEDFTLTCNDIKAIAGITVTPTGHFEVTYTATLTEDAVIGEDGNWNGAYLEYSNNPNASGSGDTGNTGDSPEDTVVAFTYQAVVNKVDGDNQPLSGATFTLVKNLEDDTTKNYGVVTANSGATFVFNGLDDGTYVLTETVPPAGGYVGIDPITFTITGGEIQTDGSEAMGTPSVNSTFTAASVYNISGDAGSEVATEGTKTGAFDTTVINRKGTELPSTGGMGTILFYTVGGIMVIGAGVVLVTKKRSKNEQ